MQVNGKSKVHWINLKKGLQLLIVYRTIEGNKENVQRMLFALRSGKKI